MKQPVILQVLPQLRSGGVERGTLEIASALKHADWTSLVASAGGPMAENLIEQGSLHLTLPLTSKHPFMLWKNAAALADIIRKYKVDIIHARSRAPAWSAYLAAKRTHTPFVTTFHGIYGLKPSFKKHYNKIMVKGDRVIAVSHFVAKHITEHYMLDVSRLRIIHNGVDLNHFNPTCALSKHMENLKSQWKVPSHLPLLLMPARVTHWKGHSVLIHALATLPHRNFFCLLLGDAKEHPNYRREIEGLIHRLGLHFHIRFAESTSHMVEAYMLADLVISPSTNPEAFGRVAIEAQAMGKLVITSDQGGACETNHEGQTGWRVKPNDAAALAYTIDKVLHLPKTDKERIGAQAREHIRAHFSLDTMQNKTLDVYRELL